MYNVQKNQRNSTLKPALHHFFIVRIAAELHCAVLFLSKPRVRGFILILQKTLKLDQNVR